jgi:hypothetical protein
LGPRGRAGRRWSDTIVDGLTIAAETHVLVYVVTTPSPMNFRLFLLRHAALLRALSDGQSGCCSRGRW